MKSARLLLACFVLVGLAGPRLLLSQVQPAVTAGHTPDQGNSVVVPFVGCASDGQAGPLKAPSGKSKAVKIPAEVAQRLAYYKAQYGAGVLGPRGWHCFSTYGSDGSNLFVSPDPLDSKTLMAMDWKGFTGQAIQISDLLGGTSGRFEVAQVIARVFPAYKAFAQKVIAGIEPASSFPFGPYPMDKLTYHGNNAVEFETPANTQGLGTISRLQVSSSPIDGVAIISGADTDLTQLSARLAEKDRDLIAAMVSEVEMEAGASQ